VGRLLECSDNEVSLSLRERDLLAFFTFLFLSKTKYIRFTSFPFYWNKEISLTDKEFGRYISGSKFEQSLHYDSIPQESQHEKEILQFGETRQFDIPTCDESH